MDFRIEPFFIERERARRGWGGSQVEGLNLGSEKIQSGIGWAEAMPALNSLILPP